MSFKKLSIYSASAGTVPIQFLQAKRSDTADQTRDREVLDDLIAPQIGERLVDLYVRFVEPVLPVVLFEHRPNASSDPVHLLAAIYLVAQAFSTFDDYLCIQTVYDRPPVEKLRDLVTTALQGAAKEPSVSLLQAALILVSSPPIDILMPDTQERYMTSGLATTMAQSLGLYHDASEWPITADEKRLRRRLSWCLRYQDQWIAFVAGRSPHISDSNWLVPELSMEDFSTAEITQGTASNTITMSKLASIMSSAHDNLYTLKSAQSLSTDFRATLRTAHPLMESLNQCYSDAINAANTAHDSEVDHAGHLLLACHSVRILLFRAMFRPFHNLETNDNIERSGGTDAYRHFRTAARVAVCNFIDFTATITAARLRAFWPFWSVGSWGYMCNLSLLLTITASLEIDHEECKAELERARKSLRLQSQSFPLLRFALLRIDSIFWKGTKDLFGLEMT